MSFSNIPLELQAIPHWCVWRLEDIGAKKPTKVPYNANNGNLANVNIPETWVDFATAVRVSMDGYSGIGFVFSDNDLYSFIDLDDTAGDQEALNRQITIFREFDSYSEISPSGKGLHIIVKGVVPAGRRRSHIEIYSSQRYATFTGNYYNPIGNGPKPIRDCQDKLMQLWHQMGDGPVAHTMYHDQPEQHDDAEIIQQATNAINGNKFSLLFKGEWQTVYPHIAAAGQGPSEADYALIDIIAFYTKNRAQIKRLFYASGLGKRQKVQRHDYVDRMILHSFDRMLPPIDFDGFRNQLELKLADGKKQEIVIEPTLPGIAAGSSNPLPASNIEIPPGLLGELAKFIYAAAPRPVPEIALAGAIGLMAGIAGRAYNVNGEGLNQYILLIAQSGTGKEAMASGIDKIIDAIKTTAPTSSRIVGPAEITSGEALIRYINKPFNQCFVSILSEFGYRLQVLSDKRNFAQTTLKKMLLDLYHKSGKGRTFKPKIFSDKDKDVGETQSPSFSILAETTPGTFYECVTEEIIADGFLPRFTLIEYRGERVPLNENRILVPNTILANTVAAFFAHCETLMHQQKVVDIPIEVDAMRELNKFDKYADNMINRQAREDIRQLWNRAHIKAWKLAGLIAVGVNPYSPSITLDNINWSLRVVHNDIKTLSSKFESGEIGSNSSIEIKQMKEIARAIKNYFTLTPEKIKTYQIKQNIFDEKKISWGYLSRKLHTLGAFNKKEERIKGNEAIKRAVEIMIDRGELRECNNISMKSSFGGREISFIVTDPSIFDNIE